MIKCNVCGAQLNPSPETTYMVEHREWLAPVKLFDAMDCPQCGCQKVLGVRMTKVKRGAEDECERQA